jgi:hypothetical protein
MPKLAKGGARFSGGIWRARSRLPATRREQSTPGEGQPNQLPEPRHPSTAASIRPLDELNPPNGRAAVRVVHE